MKFNTKLKVSSRDRAKCVCDLLGCPKAPERLGIENLIVPSWRAADTCCFVTTEQLPTETAGTQGPNSNQAAGLLWISLKAKNCPQLCPTSQIQKRWNHLHYNSVLRTASIKHEHLIHSAPCLPPGTPVRSQFQALSTCWFEPWLWFWFLEKRVL